MRRQTKKDGGQKNGPVCRFFSLLLIGCAVFAPGTVLGRAADKPPLPEPLGYVSDHAGVVDQDWKARIRSVCQDLERKTGVEMVVVTVRTVEPYATVNDYASALYERWGIGTAQRDHGVLVLAAIEERQAAITLGRSLIPVLKPQLLEQVRTRNITPAFRETQYGEGLYRTAVALASAMQDLRAGEPPRAHKKGVGGAITLFTSVGALFFLWWISRPDLRHPYGRIRRGEYWGSGLGGFGGNFGGFGGGTSGDGLR
ncbi:MAG: TPM domain-containing protein [Nitrospirota bacterium]